jgi:hypothetical protein
MSNAVYLSNLAVCTIQIIVNFLQFTLSCFIGVQRLTVSLVILDPYINVKEAMVRQSIYAYLCTCIYMYIYIYIVLRRHVNLAAELIFLALAAK